MHEQYEMIPMSGFRKEVQMVDADAKAYTCADTRRNPLA